MQRSITAPRWMVVLGACLSTACGGGGGAAGTATVSGSAGGIALGSVVDAVSFTYSGPSCTDSTKQEAFLAIVLAGSSGHCSQIQAGNAGPAGNALLLELGTVGAAPQAAIGPGTWPVTVSSSATNLGLIATVNATGCATTSWVSGSGTITLTSVSSSGVTGSFNLSFVDDNNQPNGTLSGTFTTTNCAVPSAKFCAATANHC